MRGCDRGQHRAKVRKSGLWRSPNPVAKIEVSQPSLGPPRKLFAGIHAAWFLRPPLSLLPLLGLVPQGHHHGLVPYARPSNVPVPQAWHPPLPSALLGKLLHSRDSGCAHTARAHSPAQTPACPELQNPGLVCLSGLSPPWRLNMVKPEPTTLPS